MTSSSQNSVSKTKPRIAIIGAGLAGLTMGYRLLNKGYTVALYEAKQRVGGRVHSVFVKNSSDTYSLAELGGHNITDGGKAKYFLRLAKEFNLEVEEDPRYLSRGFYADNRIYDPAALLNEHDFSRDRLEKILANVPQTATIEDVLECLFENNSILKRTFAYYVGSYEGLPCTNLPLVHNIDTLRYFLPGGGAASPDPTEKNKTFLLKHIRGGNSKLPLALAQILDGRIFLNKALKSASSTNEEIKLEFNDGTITYCDKLILANPCGTFRNISWGDSLIPKERLETLLNVEYGLNGKIIMANTRSSKSPNFNSIFRDHFGFLQNSDYQLLIGFSDGVWGKDLTVKMSEYYPLMVEIAEANYGELKNHSLLPVAASEEVFKEYKGPIFKSWAEDPYAIGSYAAVGIKLGKMFLEKTLIDDTWFRTIFTPIHDRVFFIGEHASIIEENGTMEAAIESAERLVNLSRYFYDE